MLYHYDSVFLLCSVFESSLFSSDCCKSVTLSASGAATYGWSHFLGSYEVITGEEEEGSPVYRLQADGVDFYLCRYGDGTWRATEEIGGSGYYKSVDSAAECPATLSQWQYWTDGNWHSGDITVKCN